VTSSEVTWLHRVKSLFINSMYGVISISYNIIILQIFYLFFFLLFYYRHNKGILVKWNRQRILSKVVQRIWNYLNLNFYNDWLDTYRVINISCNSIIFQIFFFYFFLLFFVGIIKAFWLNKIGKEYLSKVVQRGWNYLNLSFYNS